MTVISGTQAKAQDTSPASGDWVVTVTHMSGRTGTLGVHLHDPLSGVTVAGFVVKPEVNQTYAITGVPPGTYDVVALLGGKRDVASVTFEVNHPVNP
jgi:hypothetical protein